MVRLNKIDDSQLHLCILSRIALKSLFEKREILQKIVIIKKRICEVKNVFYTLSKALATGQQLNKVIVKKDIKNDFKK